MPSLLNLILFAAVLRQVEPTQQDHDLVNKLRSAQAVEREAAYQEIKKVGPRIIPLLEEATKDRDSELSLRASRLIRVIRLDDEIGPKLRSRFPQLAERVYDLGTQEWTAAFLEL